MEHGTWSLDRLETAVAVLSKVQNQQKQWMLAPIVRIPAQGGGDIPTMVKQVLERDVLGIIFPGTETKEQALTAVRSMRYPPQRGTKYPEPPGFRGRSGGQTWGFSKAEYQRRADVWPLNPDGELLAIIQVESVRGVQNINEILDVPGVSAVYVGQHDLAMSLGVGFTDKSLTAGLDDSEHGPEWQAAVQTVLKACLAKKVVCGRSAPNEALMTKRFNDGWRMFLGGSAAPSQIRMEMRGVGSGR